MNRTTLDRGEDQPGDAAMVFTPVRVGAVLDLDLYGREQLDVPCERRHRHRWHLDGARRCPRLRRAEIRFLARDAYKLLCDIDLRGSEVQGVDFQASDLRATHAAPGGDVDNRRVPPWQACRQLVNLLIRRDVVPVMRSLRKSHAGAWPLP